MERALIWGEWCPERDLNPRHEDFQSSALPTELSGHTNPKAVETAIVKNQRLVHRVVAVDRDFSRIFIVTVSLSPFSLQNLS
jgi:hypothetical protein